MSKLEIKGSALKINALSEKQVKILTWWMSDSKFKNANGVIADGAIRSGKTLIMSFSFIIWAMQTFDHQLFGMSGKSVGSFRRNVIIWLKPLLRARGYSVTDLKTENILEVKRNGKVNYFYIFGARDERSQDFVQGMTAAGFFFDEVVLQPESFVTQATGRCSVEGSKWWFNCNPDKPMHWFKTEWLDKAEEKGLYHLHYDLDDNPSLSESMKARYRSMYSGVFYLRYILGLWVLAEGIVYDMITDDNYYDEQILTPQVKWRCRRYIVIDYGTINPMVFLDIYDDGRISYINNEYYYDSNKKGRQKTNQEYLQDLLSFIAEDKDKIVVDRIIIDPSAASFKAEIRNAGLVPKDADNEVLEGIRLVSSAIQQRILKINKKCQNIKDEFGSYSWDNKAKDRGVEQPLKQNDHAMDCIRYFCNTIIKRRIMGR